jgi:hypothetical protein
MHEMLGMHLCDPVMLYDKMLRAHKKMAQKILGQHMLHKLHQQWTKSIGSTGASVLHGSMIWMCSPQLQRTGKLNTCSL